MKNHIFFPESCLPGETYHKKLGCIPCPDGHYKPDSGNHDCTICPMFTSPSNNFTECGVCKYMDTKAQDEKSELDALRKLANGCYIQRFLNL